jgi:transcription initiation factor IIF auxiliary subunit
MTTSYCEKLVKISKLIDELEMCNKANESQLLEAYRLEFWDPLKEDKITSLKGNIEKNKAAIANYKRDLYVLVTDQQIEA